MSDRVLIDTDGGVADVRLNRPDKHNALDAEMFIGLVEAATQLASDRSVRAVVLSGEGASFCSGLDFPSFLAGGSDVNLFARGEGVIGNIAQRSACAWQTLPQPVIAAVTGHCYGGGLQIACGCDIRIAAPDAHLSVMEIKWGLVPDMSGTQLMPRLVRPDVLKHLTWTGRKVTGEEAAALGLVTEVAADPRSAALALAHEIASKSPGAVRRAKALIDASYEVDLGTGFEMEERLQLELMGSPNQQEAVRANFEKRAPVFADE